jgi:hypothetical protein
MATQAYLTGRQKYARPQGMMWSLQPPQIIDGKYVPYGLEINDDDSAITNEAIKNQFLILSDDNRSQLSFSNNRLETRKRMINGQMRSYHIADKLNISVSWSLLPSRGFATYPKFNASSGAADATLTSSQMVTSDGGAGGSDMLSWYENNPSSFWVYLSYDKYTDFPEDEDRYLRLSEYPQAIEMFVSSFDYEVVKRGGTNHDLWNISISLEEV